MIHMVSVSDRRAQGCRGAWHDSHGLSERKRGPRGPGGRGMIHMVSVSDRRAQGCRGSCE